MTFSFWFDILNDCVIPASSKGRLTSGRKAGIQSIIDKHIPRLFVIPCSDTESI